MSEEKKKKKKEVTHISLPKAKASVSRQKEMSQYKANTEDMRKAIGTIFLILLVLFVILGGVSQTGILNAAVEWGKNVGRTVASWFEGGNVIQNSDGIYWQP